MGNNKFRLSDMIPNAWFYKLKDMGMRGKIHNSNTYSIRKKQPKTSPSSAAPPSPNPKHHHHNHHYPRKSYYFTRDLIPTCDQTFHTNSPLSTKSPHTHSPGPPPRKSSKQRAALKRRATTTTTSNRSSPKMVTTTSSVSAGCSCRASLWTNSDSPPPDCSVSPSDTSSQELFCSDSFPPEFRSDRILATINDVLVINVNNKSLQNTNQLENPNMFDEMSDLHLPPIITKPPSKFSNNGLEKEEDIKKKKDVINNPTTKNIRRRRISAKNEETEDAAAANGSFSEKQSIISTTVRERSKNNTTSSVRRNNYINSVTSPGGIRLRVNSPRIVSRRKSSGSSSISSNYSSSLSRSNNNRGGGRRSLSDSLAIVKSSFDPQKDFRESMVEMIVENNIKGSKDLEDLLACYLSLNADEYHDLIIMVFKQLWFDLTHITRPTTTTDIISSSIV